MTCVSSTSRAGHSVASGRAPRARSARAACCPALNRCVSRPRICNHVPPLRVVVARKPFPEPHLASASRIQSGMAPSTASSLDAELRKQLLALLRGGQAHAGFEKIVMGMPAHLRGVVPEHLPYSAWQILEHMRITQRDILNFSAPPTGGYHAIQWPDDYWPKSVEPPSPEAWDQTIVAIRADREQFEQLLLRPDADLVKPFRWGEGQNLLREALLIADHTAYHLGELLVLRRLLGAWETAAR